MVLSVRRRRDQRRCRRSRVWLNGVEVTRRCFYADGRRGVVRLFCEDASGKYYLVPTDWHARGVVPNIATEERRGHVRCGKA